MKAVIERALRAAVDYLTRLQDPSGLWTDFWLPVGASDAWVSAYVGLALWESAGLGPAHAGHVKRARRSARAAAQALTAQRRLTGGWGYNRWAPPDADTTAHVVSLLAAVGMSPPDDAVSFLLKHRLTDGSFTTFAVVPPDDPWGQPHLEVTAAVLRALSQTGCLNRAGLASAWQTAFAYRQDQNGWWTSFWWSTPNCATALALEVRQRAGEPPLRRPVATRLPMKAPLDLGWAIQAHIFGLKGKGVDSFVGELVDSQHADGGWAAYPRLRVPPSPGLSPSQSGTIVARDARRVFTTATAVRALACFLATNRSAQCQAPLCSPGATSPRKVSTRTIRRSQLGSALDALVEDAARAVGFGNDEAGRADALFRALTQESLASPSPWPSKQLSCLSGGSPLEFSCALAPTRATGLRYAVEIGNPYLSPSERAESAIEAISRTVRLLGYENSWRRILPAVTQLVTEVPLPPAERFVLWAGVDHTPSPSHGISNGVRLKVYINLHQRQLGKQPDRLLSALHAAGIPTLPWLSEVVRAIGSNGFLHELGFRLGPAGALDCKVYYEMDGWRRSVVDAVATRLFGPGCIHDLVPEIPGILRESLAAKSRSGLAFRIGCTRGACLDMTAASAFPQILIQSNEVRRRLSEWATKCGWNDTGYRHLSRHLLEHGATPHQETGAVHTLFTRTRAADRSWSSIYLRPLL